MDPNIYLKRKKTIVRICLFLALGAMLALVVIIPLRGLMNALSRTDYIYQRLDDYPRLSENYHAETYEWWNWWQTADHEKRVEQAVFIFESDEKHKSEKEKLAFIAETLNAEYVSVVSDGDYKRIEEKNLADGLSTYSGILSDGRLLILGLSNLQHDDLTASTEDASYFMSQFQAGLPGYVVVLHEGVLNLYPNESNEEILRDLVSTMMESGKLNPEELREKAKHSEDRVAQRVVLSSGTKRIPARKYILYSAAYADNDDFVIGIAEVSDMARFGRKRSWSLWFLCCSIMAFLGYCLWKTRLYVPGEDSAKEQRMAVKKSVSALFFAFLLTISSVIVVQKLSSANLSQQGATDQAEYLKNIIQRESNRAKQISLEFDEMYAHRAKTAAAVLSENPQLIDLDSLQSLDFALGGSRLRVYDASGELLASDEILSQFSDEKYSNGYSAETTGKDNPEAPPFRNYRAVMIDKNGHTIGWTELEVEQKQLDDLLWSTSLKELIGDLNILNTIHVAVVENRQGGKIIASTWENWIGNLAEECGINPQMFYDGYEGIVNFEGSKCYSVVFSYGDDFVIVGSEDESALVFIGGILLLTIPLLLILAFVVYRPLIRWICDYQKCRTLADPNAAECISNSEYPLLWEYLRQFMLAVFFLSIVLFIITRGNPAGLTYNILRGTWVRGVNIATITTCIMLISMVFAIKYLLDIFLSRIGEYLSPRGRTICNLLESGIAYIGTIVMILYALTMFGVNTTALVGGVGVTALIFTVGANRLISDVLAGIFIIFEGDFTVGDVVVIDGYRGIVTDIGVRTTKLMNDDTHDIKIISNSQIVALTNQSREKSTVTIDIPIGKSVGLERGEQILKEALEQFPQKLPQIIGTPEILGVPQLPSKDSDGKMGGCIVRIAFDCLEKDKEMLTYQVFRELVSLVGELNEG